ncbi:unnamed protein product [Moneuplotes crassus]|uniref:Uncharacterized protein n=1 Tax=Euplotes crassus TaxID=5936 RepID=A0AAD1Y0G7_EUPCR|nr:unnamed protein product [Moneuplotes crassus]
MDLPKCEIRNDCGDITYLIKSSPDSILDEDIFVCKKCAMSLYVQEKSIEIADAETILDCLNFSEHNIAKIDNFKESYNFEELWKKMLPDLEAFTIKSIELKDELETADIINDWKKMVDIQIQARLLLESILNSKLYKEYIRQTNYMNFRDQEAKKKPKKSLHKNTEKSKSTTKISEHIKVREQLQEENKLFQQSDLQTMHKDHIFSQNPTTIVEKDSQPASFHQEIEHEKKDIGQQQDIIQQVPGISSLENDKARLNNTNKTLNNDKSHLEKKYTKKSQDIKELQQELDSLNKKGKKKHHNITKLQEQTTPLEERKEDELQGILMKTHPKDSENNTGEEKISESEKAGLKNKVNETNSKSCIKEEIDPLEETISMKDTDLEGSKGEILNNVDSSATEKPSIKTFCTQPKKKKKGKQKYCRKGQACVNNKILPQTVPIQQNSSKTESNFKDLQTNSRLELVTAIKKRVTDILNNENTPEFSGTVVRGLCKLLKELRCTNQRRVFIKTIITCAIKEKKKDKEIMYACLLRKLSEEDNNGTQEPKPNSVLKSLPHKINFTEELLEEIRLLFIDILKQSTSDEETTNKQKEDIGKDSENVYLRSSLLKYLKLESELFKLNVFLPNLQVEILQTLIGNYTIELDFTENEFTIEAACLFLRDVGPKLDQTFAASAKDGDKEFLPLDCRWGYNEALDILYSYQVRQDLSPSLRNYIMMILDMRATGWGTGLPPQASSQDHLDRKKAKNLPSEFKCDHPYALRMLLMTVFMSWHESCICNKDFLGTFKNSPYGATILTIYLESVYYLRKEAYDCFVTFFYILYEQHIISDEDIESGLVSFFKRLPRFEAGLPHLSDPLSDLLYFIFISRGIGDFGTVLTKTEFDKIIISKEENKGIDIFFEIFASLLFKIHQFLGLDIMKTFYSKSNLETACKLLHPHIHYTHLFSDLSNQSIPSTIIELLDLPSS